MFKRLCKGMLAATLILGTSSAANAACSVSNLAGKWAVYINTAQAPGWVVCTINVSPTGLFSGICQAFNNNVSTISGGRFGFFNRSICMFNATFIAGGVPTRIDAANQSGGTLTGAMEDAYSFYYTFNAVKIPSAVRAATKPANPEVEPEFSGFKGTEITSGGFAAVLAAKPKT